MSRIDECNGPEDEICGRDSGVIACVSLMVLAVVLAALVVTAGVLLIRQGRADPIETAFLPMLDGDRAADEVELLYGWEIIGLESVNKEFVINSSRSAGMGGAGVSQVEDTPNYRTIEDLYELHCPFEDPDWCGREGARP